MATYLIGSDITIRRQEADDSDLTVIVPEVLSLSGAAARFQVKDTAGRLLIGKSTQDGSITIDGQTIYMTFSPSDTRLKSGIHRWELEVVTDGKTITVGRGNFEIIKELIN